MSHITILRPDGTREWKNANGERHREDGPAIEWANGSRNWFINGIAHRVDGPSYEDVNGYSEWWKHGKLVRKEWHVQGVLTRREHYSRGTVTRREFYSQGELVRDEAPEPKVIVWLSTSKEEGMVGQTCVITLEPITEDTVVAKCGVCKHLLAFTAMTEWFKSKGEKQCPHCRSQWKNYVKYV